MKKVKIKFTDFECNLLINGSIFYKAHIVGYNDY